MGGSCEFGKGGGRCLVSREKVRGRSLAPAVVRVLDASRSPGKARRVITRRAEVSLLDL